MDMSKNVRRLFDQFQPENYKLTVIPSADKLSFSGNVVITGQKTGRPSERITLHQKGLTISEAAVTFHDKSGAQSIPVSRINNQDSYDEVRIHSDKTLYTGTYTIELAFSGNITTPMHGLYPCFYDHDGEKKQLLATQFESHFAREVFPCIDEPEAKATFDLTLVTPKGEVALSNTPALSSDNYSDSQVITTFETTPIMSTYLLAFVVGEMQYVEGKTNSGIAMRTWSTIAQPIDSLNYANEQAIKILEFFTDYFQTDYPLSKCDQVALPDFEAGAMENWGLITYREIALLADPHNRSLTSEQYVSMVVAHELSHQWFGDLVTMKWWDDLWLNESFASLMEHIALDNLHPDWHQWEQYTASDVISCSSRDVFKDVQSVHVEVKHPDEISTLFDPAIVYAKGGRLLKMMREYIGDDAFRAGLKSYFTKYAYKNTIGDDLWAELSAASGKDIKAFMDPWLDQSGMPVLSANHTQDSIELSQQRFVLDKEEDDNQWPIPLLADQTLDADILHDKQQQITRPSKNPVILNKNGSAHVLVNYIDQETRMFIADSFANQTLSAESRINILNDQLLLARHGDTPLTTALDIVSKSSAESRDAVWAIMSRAISVALGLTEGNATTEKQIKAYRLQLVQDWYDKLGWDDNPEDSSNDIALRQTILSLAAASNYQPAIDEAKRRYEAAGNVDKLPAEQRSLIVATLIKAGEPIVDDLISEYQSSPNPDVQLSICAGLTSTQDIEIGNTIIERALGPQGFVRPQDIFRWYAYLMRNRYTRPAAWQWLKDNWDRLGELFGDSKSFDYFVIYSAAPINTAEGQKEFNDFFVPKSDIIALTRNIAIGQSEIEARVQWRNREEPALIEYFKTLSV